MFEKIIEAIQLWNKQRKCKHVYQYKGCFMNGFTRRYTYRCVICGKEMEKEEREVPPWQS